MYLPLHSVHVRTFQIKSAVFPRLQIQRLIVRIRDHLLDTLSDYPPDDLRSVFIREDIVVVRSQRVHTIMGNLLDRAAHAGHMENPDAAMAELPAILHQHPVAILKLRFHTLTAHRNDFVRSRNCAAVKEMVTIAPPAKCFLGSGERQNASHKSGEAYVLSTVMRQLYHNAL